MSKRCQLAYSAIQNYPRTKIHYFTDYNNQDLFAIYPFTQLASYFSKPNIVCEIIQSFRSYCRLLSKHNHEPKLRKEERRKRQTKRQRQVHPKLQPTIKVQQYQSRSLGSPQEITKLRIMQGSSNTQQNKYQKNMDARWHSTS